MDRVPEPELMDELEQAIAYDEADFTAPNERFVELVEAMIPDDFDGAMLDLGCGPADIPLRLLERYPAMRAVAVDGAEAMLLRAEGRRAQAAPPVAERLELQHVNLPDDAIAGAPFDLLLSNSLLHHLHDPGGLWATITRVGRPGAHVLVGDLRRPEDEATLEALVRDYASEDPEVLRRDFTNSLRAAFTPDEIREQLAQAGLGGLEVEPIGDRHVIVRGVLSD